MKCYQANIRTMDYATFTTDRMSQPLVSVGHLNDRNDFVPDVSFWFNGTISFGTRFGFDSIVSGNNNAKYGFPLSVMNIMTSILSNTEDKEVFEALRAMICDAWYSSLSESVYEEIVSEVGLGECPITKDRVDFKRLNDICQSGKYFAPVMEVEIGGGIFFIASNGSVTMHEPCSITFDDMGRLIHTIEATKMLLHDSKYPFNRDVKEISIEEFEKLFSE